ncbi:hypothetical protein DM30_16655 [Brucella abortus]|nr:hypothetical protein DM30_10170 [Brucella abortus]AIN92590.1 hypothetical protein DM30_16655 [Brucella abortus]
MRGVQAFIVIAEYLDHPALVNTAMGGAVEHSQEFCFQGLKPGNAKLHFCQAGTRYCIGYRA